MKKLSWLLTLILAATVINYPNPFNPVGGQATTFECTSDTTTEALLYIYDMSARLMQRMNFNLQGGVTNKTGWDGYSYSNEIVGNGIYLYQVVTTSGQRVGKGKIWVINQ
ncbi:MAG: T9SS type A sorting domain-containing protein [Candidatus Margulisbacteria bacterium]|nr:T9SS type A sorting domain-containing protein [Candidatus Margulisiibacteriota bacterium]